jgi:hypothetical protein
LVEPQARRYTKSGHRPAIAVADDNDVEMDGGPVKDEDMDSCSQPVLPPEKVNLYQYSGLTRLKTNSVCLSQPEAQA